MWKRSHYLLLHYGNRTNIIIIFGIMQITKSISFDDPAVLNTVRGAFLVSNALIALLYGYIYILIRKQKGRT